MIIQHTLKITAGIGAARALVMGVKLVMEGPLVEWAAPKNEN